MSLTGAFIDRYNDATDDDATAMRDGIGANKAWADSAPDDTALPYIIVKHITTGLEIESKGQGKRIMDATVQVDVWETAGDVDALLDLIETTYVGNTITITGRSHLSTHFNNRMVEQEKPNLWKGMIEFRVLYEKGA